MQKPRPKHRPSEKPTHWAPVADWYDNLVGDEGSEYHQHVILPGILRLLHLETRNSKLETSLKILDLACGQGVLSRKLAKLGCQVTALDAAAPLIEAAKKRNESEQLPIHYQIADATKLLPLAPPLTENAFDAITLILAIQNMTPLSPIWQACHALLKPAGKLLIVMMHPCFRIPKKSDWLWQDKAPILDAPAQGRIIYDYLASQKIDIQTHPGKAAHGKESPATTHFHRPLQAYINTLGNAHLPITHIEEWPSHKSNQPGPKQKPLNHARTQIPMFLLLQSSKTEPAKQSP